MTDMQRLIDAVEAGTVPDETVSLAPFCYSGQFETGRQAMLAYFGSLDAAKALHEALLPEWGWTLDAGDGAYVENRGDFGDIITADVPGNPARAWLLAILRAKVAEGGE